jgi:hypothetical protein
VFENFIMCLFVYLIDLAQDRDRWRALVNTVLYVLLPQNAGNFLTN